MVTVKLEPVAYTLTAVGTNAMDLTLPSGVERAVAAAPGHQLPATVTVTQTTGATVTRTVELKLAAAPPVKAKKHKHKKHHKPKRRHKKHR
jgi:hypothetical protein